MSREEELTALYWKDVCTVAIALERSGLYYDVRLVILQQCFLSLKEFFDNVEEAKKQSDLVTRLKLLKIRGPKNASDLNLLYLINTGRLELSQNWESAMRYVTWRREEDFFRFNLKI